MIRDLRDVGDFRDLGDLSKLNGDVVQNKIIVHIRQRLSVNNVTESIYTSSGRRELSEK